MKNNDQAQFAKDVYQVPEQPASFNDAELNDEVVEQRFADIAREEVRLRFEEMTKELALSASGIEEPKPSTVEVYETHPIALELMEIGKNVRELRAKHHAELIEIQTKSGLGRRIVGGLLQKGSVDAKKTTKTSEAIHHELVEKEAKLSRPYIFPIDKEVSSLKFFYLPNDNYDEWFHQQTSSNRAKNFTNSYIVTPYGFQKSSTFFDEESGRVRNVSVIPDDEEIKNLKHAATQYHRHVTHKIYSKPAKSRRWYNIKNDTDLAA